MKKVIKKTVLSLIGIVVVILGLVACEESEQEKPSYANILSTQAIAAINSMSDVSEGKQNLYTKKTYEETENEETISTLETIITQGKLIFFNNLEVEVIKSDLDKYDYLMIAKYDGSEYLIYFENLNQRIEIDEEDGEKEYTFTYNGIVKNEEMEYPFNAVEEVEISSEEEETEIEFVLTVSETKKIVIKQENEIEQSESENMFRFKIIENGKVVYDYKLNKEVEDNEEQISCTINGAKFKLKFDVSKNKVILKTNDFKCELPYDNLDNEELITGFINELKNNGFIENPSIGIE